MRWSQVLFKVVIHHTPIRDACKLCNCAMSYLFSIVNILYCYLLNVTTVCFTETQRKAYNFFVWMWFSGLFWPV